MKFGSRGAAHLDRGACVSARRFAVTWTRGAGARGVGLAALALACEVASAPEVPTPAATAATSEACVPAEAVDFTWALEPVPEDISQGVACVLGEVVAAGNELTMPLDCAEPEGARARTLWVQATPTPPSAALHPGLAVRLWAIEATDEAGGAGSFVRLETAGGGLLVAGAQAGALLPPGGSDPWLPFVITPGVSRCMAEETACGAQERSALDLRRAGGRPKVVHDASFAAVGDRGEAQLWVSAAILGDAACVGATGAWYSVGLMAAR